MLDFSTLLQVKMSVCAVCAKTKFAGAQIYMGLFPSSCEVIERVFASIEHICQAMLHA